MSKIAKEFKEFAIKGNMVDIAIGMIIGAAFNGVVNTLVKQVLMPPLSLLTGGINFENKKLILRQAIMNGDQVVREQVAMEYGTLFTQLLNFFIVAVCVFFVVKISNRIRSMAQDPEEEKETTPKDIQLLSDLKKIMEEQNELLRDNQTKI